MSKYRVYELAKEFETTSKVIIDILSRNNIAAKNHMSSVEEDGKNIIQHTFARKSEQSVKPQAAAAAPKAPQRPPVREGVQPSGNQSRSHNPNNNQISHERQGQSANRPPQHRPYNNQGNNNMMQRPQAGSNQSPGGGAPRPNQQRTNQPYNQARQTQNNPQARSNNNSGGQRPAGAQQGQRPFGTQQSQRPNGTQQGQRPNGAQQGQRPNGTQQGQQRSQGNFNGNGKRPYQQGSNRYSQNRNHNHQRRQNIPAPVKQEMPKPKSVRMGESITVKDLAMKMAREVSEIIKKLMTLGIMVTINQEIDFDTATLLAAEFEVTVDALPPEEDPTEIPEIEDDEQSLVLRPPVVTVMGHVDHGKTSLLDSIRKTRVTAHEAGGITQHIGAYQVMCKGKRIVFLDTPGHEAFTAMRARGAQITDIAILVVAADDGVMPQTIEAINHAKSAKVPIIVAINKMDREGANPERVKQQLAEHGLIPEDWGGDTIMVPVSAHQKTGIDDLLEMILLVAEMQEIKANPNRAAYGIIIEAKLDKGRGTVATILVQKGTLRIGDSIIAGTAYGKVRAMVNDRGEKVKKAEPSTPVEVLGLADVPEAGDIMVAVEEKVARAVAEKRIAKKRTEEMQQSQKVSLDDLFKQIQDGNIKDLNIVIKGDVQGSVEALKQSLLALNDESTEVRVNIVHAAAGAINESDVMLASASNALMIGFNVRPDGNARKAAETEKIDLRTYRVIYDAINDVEAAMKGMLAPEFKEVVLGRLEVRQVISVPKTVVAGSYVLEGKITNASKLRILRENIVIHEGEVEALKRFKDDVKEVAAGYECGVSIEKYRDIKEGDILEAFIMEEVKPNSL
ncbi:MAG: translation initiation factor IF-2 [Pelosinus sp.]|nr:translation initiation factor IF-2 [Pelosinus sp.]